MNRTVEFPGKAKKQTEKLPRKIREILLTLVREIGEAGPVRGDWPNYSKLSAHEHHCYLKKDKPIYVAIWREDEGRIRVVEVPYAGTHEKAPY